MILSSNPAVTMLDSKSIDHWALAVNIPASRVFIEPRCDNVLEYSIRHATFFRPDYDDDGAVMSNERLENFRLALVYETLANLLDIAEHLDDDPADSLAFYNRLVANDVDANNVPSWLSTPNPYSVTYRTHTHIDR